MEKSEHDDRSNNHAKVTDETANRDDLEMGNIFTADKNKVNLMSHLNSSKLLDISARFQLYPD